MDKTFDLDVIAQENEFVEDWFMAESVGAGIWEATKSCGPDFDKCMESTRDQERCIEPFTFCVANFLDQKNFLSCSNGGSQRECAFNIVANEMMRTPVRTRSLQEKATYESCVSQNFGFIECFSRLAPVQRKHFELCMASNANDIHQCKDQLKELMKISGQWARSIDE